MCTSCLLIALIVLMTYKEKCTYNCTSPCHTSFWVPFYTRCTFCTFVTTQIACLTLFSRCRNPRCTTYLGCTPCTSCWFIGRGTLCVHFIYIYIYIYICTYDVPNTYCQGTWKVHIRYTYVRILPTLCTLCLRLWYICTFLVCLPFSLYDFKNIKSQYSERT